MNYAHEEQYKGYDIKIAYDEQPDNPFDMDEGLGKFYHWKEHDHKELVIYCDTLGYDIDTHEKIRKDNPDAVRIDKYEHSSISYSVEGEGIQCRWDTSSTWAVWLPNKCLLDELKGLKGKKRRAKCIEFARQACEVFNKWANGEVYGFIVELEGENIDSCWGFYDRDDAISEAKNVVDWNIKEAGKLQLQY